MTPTEWADLLEYLVNEMNEETAVYTLKHNGVKGTWFIKEVKIPSNEDQPITVSWTKHITEALMFSSLKMLEDFVMIHIVPRPCSIIKIRTV